jgi:hypothetical protein
LLCDQVGDFRLLDFEIGLRFEDLAHFQAVSLFVALGSGRPYGWAARGIQQTELDANGVGDLAHDAAQGVDFADQVSFGNPSYSRIAGHLRDEIDVERIESRFQAHARGGHGGFAPGMAGADYDYVELFGELH